MTTVYLMRHSESLKPVNYNNGDSLQLQNEKYPLSINGEMLDKEKSNIEELKKFDVVISSNYVRAISTAKYFTDGDILIDSSFGERKFGVNDYSELPKGFELMQYKDHDFKMPSGESLNEVFEREYKALLDILNKYKDKKVLVVGHSTAIACLLSKWVKVSIDGPYTFNDVPFFDGKWKHLECFKLVFDNDRLVEIETI